MDGRLSLHVDVDNFNFRPEQLKDVLVRVGIYEDDGSVFADTEALTTGYDQFVSLCITGVYIPWLITEHMAFIASDKFQFIS